MDKISIIISVYNKEKFLEKTLWSVRNLKTRGLFDVEIILIDDGSSDSSFEIISKFDFGDKNKNKKILKNNTNKGVSFSLNLGLKNATGNYVYFLDADDIVFMLGLVLLFRGIKDSLAEMAVGIVLQTDRNLQIKNVYRNLIYTNEYFLNKTETLKLVDDILNFKISMSHIGILFKRDLIESFGGFNNDMKSSQDLFLILSSLLNCKYGLYYAHSLVGAYRQSSIEENIEDSLWLRSISSGSKAKDYEVMHRVIKNLLTEQQSNRLKEITNMINNLQNIKTNQNE